MTSERGDNVAPHEAFWFEEGFASENVIHVFPAKTRQKIMGIGTSFTESSAYVLAHLDSATRAEVMERIYGESGANFSMARTHIGACDFCVSGRYSYAQEPHDSDLTSFSIAVDREGFSRSLHPGIQDEQFDLLPMIKQAIAIKEQQEDSDLRIIGSAWTAPSWMKDIEDWYIPGSDENGYQGTGGQLKPEYQETYAHYLNKYLTAYRDCGVNIWGLTPVNEPCGNNGQWESMHFSAQSQNSFVRDYLGPSLREHGNEHVKLMMFDHNRGELEEWADVLYRDPQTRQYLYGAAVHWYESSFKVSEDVLDSVHAKYPEQAIIHTEGCIDDLGKDAPEGILDPERFKESDWFGNDAFWWNDNATDWAYSATWPGVVAEDHPIYTPVHRYARNIIQSFNHWVSGWIDWNIVLDSNGGPNHVGNYCGAPIMIDTSNNEVYYTPVFYTLAQLSRTMRPEDYMVDVQLNGMKLASDDVYACASVNAENVLSVQILNTSKMYRVCNLQIGAQFAPINVEANALHTVRVQL